MQTNLVEIEKYISPMPHRIRTNHLTWIKFVYRQVRPMNKKIGQMPWRRNMLTSMCNDFSPAIARVCPQWHLQSKSVNLARKLLYWILPRPGYYLTLNNTSLFMEKNGESFPILRLYFANINITHVWFTHTQSCHASICHIMSALVQHYFPLSHKVCSQIHITTNFVCK